MKDQSKTREQLVEELARLRRRIAELESAETARKRAEDVLRESEERYRGLVDNVSIGIALISPQMQVLSMNNQMRAWFPETDVSRKPACHRAFNDPPKDDICSYCPTVKTLKDGLVHDEVIETRVDGEIRNYRIVASPIRDRAGAIVAAIEMVEDITETIQMQKELAKAEQLESIRLLAGGIAHDFNNILTAIIGSVSLARMEAEPGSDISQLLADAERASARARDLTEQLLTFSRGGAPILRTTTIDNIIRDSAGFALRGSNVKCDFSIPDDLWAVDADEGQICQVINNLIINADQAMPDGGTITVRSGNTTVGDMSDLPLKPGRYVMISIADQGTGISGENLKRIFDPFFTTKQKGTGFGLASTYSIIKKHGGHIDVESQVDVGTSFFIYLPASTKAPVPRHETEPMLTRGSGRILVMDDDESIRNLAGIVLPKLGYEVCSAADGSEAIRLYREAIESGQPFDAAIMDLTVPGGMGGREAIARLRRIDPDIKAIVCSGYSNHPVMDDFEAHGFCAAVAKPYRASELGQVLCQVLATADEAKVMI